jgi:transposase
MHQASTFVGVRNASSPTYAGAHLRQGLPRWIRPNEHTVALVGGLPDVLVPDSPTSGVRHPCRHEPDLHPSYPDFATHHGLGVVSAWVREPSDKVKVGVGVQRFGRWIQARVRGAPDRAETPGGFGRGARPLHFV